MLNYKKNIVFTGGNGRFGKILKQKLNRKNFLFPTRQELNILSIKSIEKYLNKFKPKIFVHMAALSRPMDLHEKNISLSISTNIIGTSNVVTCCVKRNIKLIYFSTQYVYPGIKGNYKEDDGLMPVNNYGWSKLGGECSASMYKNSLILRLSMTEKPFVHKKAFANSYSNFIFHEDVVPILFKIYKKKGILNIGGKNQTIYNFAKKYNPNVKKIFLKKNNINFPRNASMSLLKLNKILKNDK